MKGWVYIITNKSMPEILKVGFSMKDPAIRAKQLITTGIPHPYTVEYEVLIESPRNVEKATHNKLSQYNENKEWFNCSIKIAIDAIKSSANKIILENCYNKEINSANRDLYKNKTTRKEQYKTEKTVKHVDIIKDVFTNVEMFDEKSDEYKLGNKNNKQAVYEFRKAAEFGDANAQYNLGLMYSIGQGVIKNYIQTVYWYRKAAEQGHRRARNNLGILYEKGQGITQSYDEAVYWYRLGAEAGLDIAQYNLAMSYGRGTGVKKNDEQAAYWFCKAAKAGLGPAQNNLGVCYEWGQGVKKDNEQAIFWYRKAASQDSENAQKNLDEILERLQN